MRRNQILPINTQEEEESEDESENQNFNEDEDEEQTFLPTNNLRITVERLLTGQSGKLIEYFTAFLSFFSVVYYILSTYITSMVDYLDTLDYIVLIYYISEFGIRLWSAPHSINFLIKASSIVDMLCIWPIFFLHNYSQMSQLGKFIRISRNIRILKVSMFANKHYKSPDSEFSSVSHQYFILFLTLTTIILLSSGILLIFENDDRYSAYVSDIAKGCTNPGKSSATFDEMIYYVVVTLATVGYGDITLASDEGRACVIILIVISIVLIPKQTNELIVLMQMQSKYARNKYRSNPEIPHILVCGHVELSALKFFCKELFHPDHGGQDKHAIILQHNPPSQEIEQFLHNPQFELFLHYLQGNPMLDRDLRRTSVYSSKACVLLTDKYITDSHSADHKNVLTGLAIKKFVHHQTKGENNIRLCIQLIKPESKAHYYSSLSFKSNDLLIVVEEFKMNLLAKSCFCPGIISLLGNLIQSAGEIDDSQYEDEWLREYMTGIGHEIYRAALSSKFEGKTFTEIAATVYNEFGGILFGIELDVGGQTIIRLNPGNYVIPNTFENKVKVYIICEDKKVADQVSNYELLQEEITQFQQMQNHQKKKQKELEKQESMFLQSIFEEDQEVQKHKGNIEDIESTEGDYVLMPESIPLINVTLISLRDSIKVTNHIVLCGIHSSIYYFILPLRAKYLKEFQYIVILCEEQPTKIWNDINRFPKIIFIKGSPLKHEDLMRANIQFADKAVIFSKEVTKEMNQVDEMLDSESIFIYKAIQKLNKNVQIMIELVFPSNIHLLHDSSDKQIAQNLIQAGDNTELIPLFAAGQVYISPMIDTLTCQTYYNPHILTVLQQILTGDKQSSAVIRAICDHADLHQSNLYQIPVPEDYFNKTFGQLFHYLATEQQLIALALYRLPGSVGNQFPYTYTNPKENTKITHRDRVFVLGQSVSSDLIKSNDETGQESMYEDFLVNEEDLSQFENLRKLDMAFSKHNNKKAPTKQEVKEQQQLNQKIDLENLNQNSATFKVMENINDQIEKIRTQISNLKLNIQEQDEDIKDKIKSAFRQEIASLLN
ncbi:hypothetical protein ABPG74_022400 [Tetrahymena malaccensis]